MSKYYIVLKSIDDAIGEENKFGLPFYALREPILDDERSNIISRAISIAISGGRVIILGERGSGKTTLLALIASKLLSQGYGVGILLYHPGTIDGSHESEGLILLADDLDKRADDVILAISKQGLRGIIATINTSSIQKIERLIGTSLNTYFTVFKIPKMSRDHLRKVALLASKALGVELTREALEELLNKADGRPGYIWYALSGIDIYLERTGKEAKPEIKQLKALPYDIDKLFIHILESQMSEEDKHALILTLAALKRMKISKINRDYLAGLFVVASEIVHKKKLPASYAITNRVMEEMLRNYFRIREGPWIEVLIDEIEKTLSAPHSYTGTIENAVLSKYSPDFNLIYTQAISKARELISRVYGDESKAKDLEKFIESTFLKDIIPKVKVKHREITKAKVNPILLEKIIRGDSEKFIGWVLETSKEIEKIRSDVVLSLKLDLSALWGCPTVNVQNLSEDFRQAVDLIIRGEELVDTSIFSNKKRLFETYLAKMIASGKQVDAHIVNWERVVLKSLAWGANPINALGITGKYLPLEAFTELLVTASVTREDKIFSPYFKELDTAKKLAVLAVNARKVEHIEKVRSMVKKSLKLERDRVIVESLLPYNTEELETILSTASSFPAEDAALVAYNATLSIISKKKELNLQDLSILMGLGEMYDNYGNYLIKLSVTTAISLVSPRRIANDIFIKSAERSELLKWCARLAGVLADEKKLSIITSKVKSATKKADLIDAAVVEGFFRLLMCKGGK